MLDKLKSLQEIIKTKANELGISFEEMLEVMDDNTRFEIFESQFKKLFPDPYRWGYIEFSENMFEYSKMALHISKEFYINLSCEDYKTILSKYIKLTYKNANIYDDEYPVVINSKIYDIKWRTEEERKTQIEAAEKRNKRGLNGSFDGLEYMKKAYKSDDLLHEYFCKIIEELHIDLTSPEYNIFILNGDLEIKTYLNHLNSFKEQLPVINVHRKRYLPSDNIEKNIQQLFWNRYLLDPIHRFPSEFLPNSLSNIVEKFETLLKEIEIMQKYKNIWYETSHDACTRAVNVGDKIRKFNFRGRNSENKKRIELHDKLNIDINYDIFIQRVNVIQKLLQTVNISKLMKYNARDIEACLSGLVKIYKKRGGVRAHYYSSKSQELNLLKLKDTIYNFKTILVK